MKAVVIDFETYYGEGYSLSLKGMTTEKYVRDERFETILCGFKVGEEDSFWCEAHDVPYYLKHLDIKNNAVIAHHAHFDGLILSHHYGVKPKLWIDTLSMARAVRGLKGVKLGLADLAKKFGLGEKGNEVVQAYGKRLHQFTPGELAAYGSYCCNDCDLEYKLAQVLGEPFNKTELQLIDNTIRAFTEPVLEINVDLLRTYLADLKARKTTLLVEAGVQLDEMRSNDKFAQVLIDMGITPPLKLSPQAGKPHPKHGTINKKTGKPYPSHHPHDLRTYAFAKTDEAMQELAEDDDEAVQAVIAARIGARSTINEARAERLIDMASRGRACVYIKYYGADQTGRAAGGDLMNWQNFTRPYEDADGVLHRAYLRESIEAPEGYECLVCDSSNIESRTEDWLVNQEDAVEAYRLYDAGRGPDIYCVMGGRIYGRVITKDKDKNERQMGKVAKLGLGYQMGWEKFIAACKAQAKVKDPATGRIKRVVLTPEESQRIVTIYRKAHPRVVAFWHRCKEVLPLIAKGVEGVKVDYRGIVTTTVGGLLLPNGLKIKYPDLEFRDEAWSYWNGRERVKIYGGKVCENIIQALARIIVMEQTLMVKRRFALSVHDEGVWCVRQDRVAEVMACAEEAFRTPLWWCPDIPLNCEAGHHRSYGKAKK